MKILYVSQYFPPEIGAPAARVFELSREWVRRGHDVSVLTGFAHHPTGFKAPRDRGVLRRREWVEGIRVVRSYVHAAPNRGSVRRMLSYSSFMASAVIFGRLSVPRPDIVVATSPQLLCAAAGWWVARGFQVPFVFEVRDLWPESILAVEALSENFIVRTLKQLAKFLYFNSSLVVTVGEGYRNSIHSKYHLPLGRMRVIPNGIDPSLFRPGVRENDIRRRHGWGDRFVCLYLGTHGMAHGLDSVLEAARLLKGKENILFAFVGEGAEKDLLVRTAISLELKNVQFIGQQPKVSVPEYYAACDLGLVTLRDTPLFQEVLPSKLFEYMGMERPILMTVGGEARKLVESAGAGEYVRPQNPQEMANAILRLSNSRDLIAQWGKSGREHVLAHYDRSVLAGRYCGVLEGIVSSRASSRAL